MKAVFFVVLFLVGFIHGRSCYLGLRRWVMVIFIRVILIYISATKAFFSGLGVVVFFVVVLVFFVVAFDKYMFDFYGG